MIHKIIRFLLICLLLAIVALPIATVGVNHNSHHAHFSLSGTAGKGTIPVFIACDHLSTNQGCSGG